MVLTYLLPRITLPRLVLPDGRALAYHERGSGPPIVLLHPAGLDHTFWHEVTEHLATRHRVIAVDLPGHGQSSPCADFITLAGVADDVATLMNALALGPAAVVGCSFGAMIAQYLTGAGKAPVCALVLSSTTSSFSFAGRLLICRRSSEATAGMHAVRDATLGRWTRPAWRRAHPQRFAQLAYLLDHMRRMNFANTWSALVGHETSAMLNRLQQPSLVVTGGADVLTPPATGQILCRELPYATLRIVPGAGHLVPYEIPQEFAAMVLAFCRATRAQSDLKANLLS